MNSIAAFTSIPYFLGLLYYSFYFIYPLFYSYLKTPKGFVWVPIGNEHGCSSDNRVFAAGVQEMRLNFFKYKHPCAPNVGNIAVDFLRSTSYRTAALLSIFISDERIAFFLSFLLSILIQFSVLFLVGSYIFHEFWIALMISIIIISWYQVVNYINLPNGIRKTYSYVLDKLINIKKRANFDLINDNFRFVIMSTAGIYVWLTILMVLSIDTLDNLPMFVIYTLYFLFIPFVYPPVSLISIFLVICNTGLSYFITKEFHEILILFSSGFLALAILFILGLAQRIRDFKVANTEVLSGAHIIEEKYDFTFKNVYRYLFRKFYFSAPLFMALILFATKNRDFAFLIITLVFFPFLKLAGFILKKNALIDRFIWRGGSHFLFFSLLISSISIVSFFLANIFNNILFVKIAILIVSIIPLWGNLRMVCPLQKSGVYYIHKEEWELFQYIKKHTLARSAILAFSYSNIQLIPAYTNANLYIRGAEWLESPDQELKKYINALKFINCSTEQFVCEFKNYFQHNFSLFINPEKQPEHTLKGFHLINSLIYFPFVKYINGIKLTNDANNSWTDQFVNYLENLISNADGKIELSEVDHIVIDKDEINNFQVPKQYYEIKYSNSKYVFFTRV